MPGGKVLTRGAVGWRLRWIDGLALSALCDIRKPGVAPLSASEELELTQRFRDAISQYCVAHQNPMFTPTKRLALLRRIKSAARSLEMSPDDEEAREALLVSLECDFYTRREIHFYLRRREVDFSLRVNEFATAGVFAEPLSPSVQEMLGVLAGLDIRSMSAKTPWTDPPLVDLVRALMPIWQRVTGYSPGVSNGRAPELASRFSAQLRSLLRTMGRPAPPENTISRIVKRLQSARRSHKPRDSAAK